MGVVLSPKKENVEELSASFWAWRPVVALLKNANVIDLETLGPIPDSFQFAEVDLAQAQNIVDYLDRFIGEMKPDERVLLDGTHTNVPDSFEFYRSEEESYKNYSTPFRWLGQFRDFCRASGGFVVN